MSKNTVQIVRELKSLGYSTCISDSPHGDVISFVYIVETGSHKGESVTVGIRVGDIEHYPEYPPHWIHLTPPINDGKGGSTGVYTDSLGREWITLSRPPEDIWDSLPERNMRFFINEHLRRLWTNV